MTKMNAEVKAKWLAALRSGEYKQTEGELKTETQEFCGFCCLGVLSDIHSKETGEGEWIVHEEYDLLEYKDSQGFSENGVPPPGVLNWAGLCENNPTIFETHANEDKIKSTVAELNDNGKTFKEIADLIEEQL